MGFWACIIPRMAVGKEITPKITVSVYKRFFSLPCPSDVFIGTVTVPVSLITGTASKKEQTGWFNITPTRTFSATRSPSGQVKLSYLYKPAYRGILTKEQTGDNGASVSSASLTTMTMPH